ncbi:hypothetical protein QQ008_28895 [Fulvivirgaceae bacterium BMA10]|uniref:Uncharacterized protein n=1 Tax=Splendidivirga corallicola TaxID=3051826 RepID=A0ABT8KYL2_9BACT|nr:hypothetical protein [Fulvivirgaceae bacterium BMA10]
MKKVKFLTSFFLVILFIISCNKEEIQPDSSSINLRETRTGGGLTGEDVNGPITDGVGDPLCNTVFIYNWEQICWYRFDGDNWVADGCDDWVLKGIEEHDTCQNGPIPDNATSTGGGNNRYEIRNTSNKPVDLRFLNCQSFRFVPVAGGSTYQVAAVRGIRVDNLSLKEIWGMPAIEYIWADLPTLYFELPRISHDGDYKGTGGAADVCARMANLTEKILEGIYSSRKYPPSRTQLINDYVRESNKLLRWYGGRVSLGNHYGVVGATQAIYTPLTPGNCGQYD